MPELYYSKAVNEALDEELARDKNVILMGEDIGPYGGAFGVTKDKNTSVAVAQRLFPDVSLLRTEKCRKPDDGFAEALSKLDSLIMLPIYPARELPIEGVSSEMILDKVTVKDKVLVEKDQLMDTIKNKDIECLVTFGAGDIDRFVPKIEEYLKSR